MAITEGLLTIPLRSSVKVAPHVLEQVLAFPEGVRVIGASFQDGVVTLEVEGTTFGGIKANATTHVHWCEGQRWYKTEIHPASVVIPT
jgi:hypothetical protein